MKLLLKEENKDLPNENLIVKTFCLLLLLSINLFSQTILNNFGVTEVINTYPGNSKFSFIDFNQDGIDDIIVFGNQEKNFVLHQGLPDSTFAPAEKKFFFFPIDDFKWLTTSNNGSNYYLFVSRNKRLAGLVSFTSNSSLQLLFKTEFNSYPQSIDIIDLNGDMKNEAIIYGPNFNGLAIIQNNGYRLKVKNILEQNVFREITQLDFNQDGIDDLVAIDIMNNSLKFIENFSEDFVEGREISFDAQLSSVKKIFFDDDEFADLAVAKEGGIEILLGDSVYSFTENYVYNFNFFPESFEFDDFNNNGFKDIALINKIGNEIIVGLNGKDSYNSILYHFDGIVDLKYLKNANINALLLLSKKGKIEKLNKQKKWNRSFTYSIGGKPNKIGIKRSIDGSDDKILFTDLKENDISILYKNKKGDFTRIIKEKFINPITDFSFSRKTNLIAGYSVNNRLIEIRAIVTKQKANANQNFIYTAYPIEKLLIDSTDSFYTLLKSKTNLFFQKISLDSGQYKTKPPVLLDTSVTSVMANGINDFYYWQKTNEAVKFLNKKENLSNEIFSFTSQEKDKIKTIIVDKERKNKSESILTLIHQNGKEELLLFDGTNKRRFKIKSPFLFDNNFDSSNFWYNVNKNKEHFLFVKKNNLVQKYKMDFPSQTLVLYKDIQTKNIQNYFIDNFFGKLFIVYTTSDNFIEFKRI